MLIHIKIYYMSANCGFGPVQDVRGRSFCLLGKVMIDEFRNLDAKNIKASTLYLRKDANIMGDLTINGNTKIDSLTVEGPTTTDSLTVNDSLTVHGDITGNSLVINDHAKLQDANICGNLVVLGTLTANVGVINMMGNCILSENGMVEVCATDSGVEIDGPTTLNGELLICGNTNIKGSLDVTSDITAMENLMVMQDVVVTEDLIVNGNTDVSGNLTVNGDSEIMGDLTISGNVTGIIGEIMSQSIISDSITANSASFNDGLNMNCSDVNSVQNLGVNTLLADCSATEITMGNTIVMAPETQINFTDGIVIGNIQTKASESAIAIGGNASAFNLSTFHNGQIAIGQGTNSVEESSISIGWGASAIYNGSIAIGGKIDYGGFGVIPAARALAGKSVVIGSGAYAGDFAIENVAIGYYGQADGFWSVAIGSRAVAESSGSVSIGGYSYCKINDSVSIGYYANCVAQYSVSIGGRSKAEGGRSVAIGGRAYATGDRSISIGWESEAIGDFDIAIGSSSPTGNPTATAWGQIFQNREWIDGNNLIASIDGSGNIIKGGDINSNGKLTTQELCVNGDTSFLGNVFISGNLEAGVQSFSAGTTGFTPSTPEMGAVVLGGILNVSNGGTGLSSLGTSNQLLGVNMAGTGFEYKNDISLTGGGTFEGNVSANNFDTSGKITTSDLCVTNNVDIDGTLTVDGETTLGNTSITNLTVTNLTVTENTQIKDLEVVGNSQISGNLNVMGSITGDLNVEDKLTTQELCVNGDTSFFGNVFISGNLEAGVQSFSAGTTGFTPSTSAMGAVVLGGILNVSNGGTGLSSLGTSNQILGINTGGTSFEYKNEISLTGGATFGGNVSTNNFDTSGKITTSDLCVTNNVDIDGTLTVDGDTTLSNTTLANTTITNLTVSGDGQFDNDVNVDGTLTVNEVSVSNNANVNGDLIVNGTTQLTGDLSINGNIDIVNANTINVMDDSVFCGNVLVKGEFNVLGETLLDSIFVDTINANTITISEESNLCGNVDIKGNVEILGDLNIAGNVFASNLGIETQDEGSTLNSAAKTLNFTGVGVTASDTSGVTTVSISGSGGSFSFSGKNTNTTNTAQITIWGSVTTNINGGGNNLTTTGNGRYRVPAGFSGLYKVHAQYVSSDFIGVTLYWGPNINPAVPNNTFSGLRFQPTTPKMCFIDTVVFLNENDYIFLYQDFGHQSTAGGAFLSLYSLF
jgi:cytoskeletal protein CcmA (bactofilin family)